MTTYPLEQAGRAMSELEVALVEQLRAKVGRSLHHLYARAVAASPRLEGEFAAAWWPFLNEPVIPTWAEGDTSPAGAGVVDDVMTRWKPGDTVGIANDAPQAIKLVFHAGTYTKKARPGWLELILDEARVLLVTS